MKNSAGEIIYIGKAKALKNRVSQYFGSQNGHNAKVRAMVEHVDRFDYILCDSEFEALVLECSLIKQNMPKYNILLKDSKGYSYIKITANPYGNIFASYRKDDENASYLGPYTGNFSVANAVDEAKEIFMLPTCNKRFPRDIGKQRPCLNFHIGKCSAPCAGKISQQDYERNLADAIAFLKNGRSRAIDELKARMLKASDELDFETAAKLRDKLRCIERIKARQKVVTSETKNMDIFGLSQSSGHSCLAVLSFREGLLVGTEHFIDDESDNLPQFRHELVMSYYIGGREIPPKIMLDGEMADSEILAEYLGKKLGKKVEISVPQRGETEKLVKMCLSNASQKLADYLGKKGADIAVLDELAKALSLPKAPVFIESYDNSHTDGADNVCGMVVFENGRPNKKLYRKFIIKEATGGDDYGSMNEALIRRFGEYLKAQNAPDGEKVDEAFARLPDLILLDGGIGQVHAVKPVLEAFDLDIPVFGMVKDNKHRTRAIAHDGGEVHIKDDRRMFTLISNIQEEVHRFAITFHKKRHTKTTLEGTLTKIHGIGNKKAELLLKHFKSLKAIKGATEEQLSECPGISKADAKQIVSFFAK